MPSVGRDAKERDLSSDATVGAGGFIGELYASWGKPDWFLAGTSLEKHQLIPQRLPVQDYLRIYGNIAQNHANPGYFIDYALAGVPLFKGGLDLGMQCAPNLRAVFELVCRYADNRLPCLGHMFVDEQEGVGLALVSKSDLGPGRHIILETPLLVLARLASRHLGRPPSEAVIELQHGPSAYSETYRLAVGCTVLYGAHRDAITLPAELCHRPSMTYDADLWRTATYRCAEEARQSATDSYLHALRTTAAKFLAENGRPARLVELARQNGVSTRTLVRRLRSENQTYQAITDDLLKAKCIELLAQPNLKISDVSERLGFADPSSFYRSFRRWYRTTPREFQQQTVQ